MSINENDNSGNKRATDRLHDSDLGETKDFNNLTFNEEENSFEIDVKGEEEDYDHPLPYETAAPNGEDDNSDYDEQNPYIGGEYDSKKEQMEAGLEDLGMHVESRENLELSAEDEILSRTPEDDRTDLDEEGYPINDSPPMP